MQLEHSFSVPVSVEEAWTVLLDVERIAPCMPGATLETVGEEEFTGKVKIKVGPITVTYGGSARFTSRDEAARQVVLVASAKETRGSGTAKATVTASLIAADGGSSTDVKVLTDLAITGKPAQFGRGVMADVGGKLIGQFASCLSDEIIAAGDAAAAAEPDTTSEPPGPVRAAEPASAVAPTSPAALLTPQPALTSTATLPAPAADPSSNGASGSSAAVGTVPATGGTGPAAPAGQRPARGQRESAPIDLLDAAGAPVAKRAVPAAIGAALLVVLLVVLRRRRS